MINRRSLLCGTFVLPFVWSEVVNTETIVEEAIPTNITNIVKNKIGLDFEYSEELHQIISNMYNLDITKIIPNMYGTEITSINQIQQETMTSSQGVLSSERWVSFKTNDKRDEIMWICGSKIYRKNEMPFDPDRIFEKATSKRS